MVGYHHSRVSWLGWYTLCSIYEVRSIDLVLLISFVTRYRLFREYCFKLWPCSFLCLFRMVVCSVPTWGWCAVCRSFRAFTLSAGRAWSYQTVVCRVRLFDSLGVMGGFAVPLIVANSIVIVSKLLFGWCMSSFVRFRVEAAGCLTSSATVSCRMQYCGSVISEWSRSLFWQLRWILART